MARGAAPPPQQGGDNSLDILWIIALIIVGIVLFWYLASDYIVAATFWIKKYEIYTVKAVIRFFYDIVDDFYHVDYPSFLSLNSALDLIKSGQTVNPKELYHLCETVGAYVRYPFGILLLIFAGRTYFGGVSNIFKRTYSMSLFRSENVKTWPKIAPVSKLNLISTDIDQGPWAMAQTPVQFCKKHNLMTIEKDNRGKNKISLKLEPAYRVFAMQLGPVWTGNLRSLPVHIRTLMGIFAARANGKVDETEEALNKIAQSTLNGKVSFEGFADKFTSYLYTPAVEKVFQSHAYVYTVMASLLVLARTVGVLATAEFIWLKPYDRRLWYILNNVGRQSAQTEVAGIFAHWRAEEKLGYALRAPYIDTAVKALDEALHEIDYDEGVN